MGTLAAVLTAPTQFFRRLGTERIGGSLSFLGAVFLPALFVQGTSVYLAFTAEIGPLARLPRVYFADASLLVEGALALALGAVFLIAYLATFYQAASAMASGRKPPFRATVRGVCFGFAPMILGIVPIIGAPIGLLWSLVLHVIALRELHGLGTLKASGVVMLPLVVMVLRFVYG